MSTSIYAEDLAFIHAVSFSDFALRIAPWIVARLGASKAPVRRVIDIGCGAGVTTRALVDAGVEAIGVEPSPFLVELARSAVPEATFHAASVYDFDLPRCDAILAVGEPLTYHPPESDADRRVRSFFRRAADAMRPGGQFIFDVIGLDGPPLDAKAYRSDDDWAILYETRESRASRWLTRTVETFRRVGESYRRSREVHHVRLFEREALAEWLDQAGFDVEIASSYGPHALPPRRVAIFATRRTFV